MLAFQRGKKISTVANEILDRNLPRWTLERTDAGADGVGKNDRGGRELSMRDDRGDEIAAALDRLPSWGFRPPPGLA
jgi:hypothetical protein